MIGNQLTSSLMLPSLEICLFSVMSSLLEPRYIDSRDWRSILAKAHWRKSYEPAARDGESMVSSGTTSSHQFQKLANAISSCLSSASCAYELVVVA
jgi:hypothetical protein